MPVQHEVKSQLAKLLATEDLVVEHKHVETAQFNVHTRVLILPLWDKASHDVYDMLVGHEVGHALFTPDEWDWEDRIPAQFVNVVEDARIEKLMKRKYMGLAKSFYKGYSELHSKDFFQIDGEDLNNFNLADRANLFFKIGSFLSLAFSTTEKPIINLIHDCETFEDTLYAAEALYNFCKQEQKKEKQGRQDLDANIESPGDSGSSSDIDFQSPLSDSDSTPDVEDRSDFVDSDVGMDDPDPVVETAETLSKKLQQLVTNVGGVENVYVEFPELNLDTVIGLNEEFHSICEESFTKSQETWDIAHKQFGEKQIDLFTEPDLEFKDFKKSAQKEVNYLVKEFECRKAADNYSRSAISRTGVLSTEKLHNYKFDEDLFKKINILPDGKNHGLVFVLDWSGSMADVLQDTLKQLYNLLWFCKKVHVPFEVYAFSNHWNSGNVTYHYKREEGKFLIENDFGLMNIFTHKVNGKTLDQQMKTIWRVAYSFRYGPYYQVPYRVCLSGTPLNESLVALYKLLPKFQKDNKLQKVQCVILTDGEANQLPYHVMVPTRNEWDRLGCRNCKPDRTLIRNRKTGKTYKFGYYWNHFTDACLRNLRDTYPSVNFIGIRVLANRDANSFIKLYDHSEKVQRDWKKNRSFVIKNSGYHAYFGMSANSLANDDTFEVKEDATKAQIKNAFIKSLKTKKLNKKILGEFIELIV